MLSKIVTRVTSRNNTNMGGSSSRERKKKQSERSQAKNEDFKNNYNFNTHQYFETNSNAGASNSDNNPNRHYNLHYECSSSSIELHNMTAAAKSLNNDINIPNQLFPHSSNSNYYPVMKTEFNQNILHKSDQNYSKDNLISNLTLRAQPIGTEVSRMSNNYDEYIDLTNYSNSYEGCIDIANSLSSAPTVINQNCGVNKQPNDPHNKVENSQIIIGKVGGLKHNSGELDEDEGSSNVECTSFQPLEKSLSKHETLFDSPVKPQVKRKVPYNHSPTLANPYSTLCGIQPQYKHDDDCNSDCDNYCGGGTSEVVLSVNEYDLDSSFDVLDILSFPFEWTSCEMETTGLVDITPESVEGRNVLRLFNKTSVSSSFKLVIQNVTRIENPFLHSLYMLKKEEMQSRNGNVDELYLYHGTKGKNVDQICQDNLNWRLYTERHRFGRGVSFSPSAIYSSHYSDPSDKKVMFLFKVLVSNAVFGSSDMVIPPISDAVFDTSIKDDTSVVVKYSDNEFYPLYKITYTRQSNFL